MHFEILTNKTTAAGAAGIAGTVLTGDSNTVRNGSGKVSLIAGWSTRQVAGFSQLQFPSGHDTTRGMRTYVPIATGTQTIPFGTELRVEPQETLATLMAGSAVAGDIEHDSYLAMYDNFPGISMRAITAEAVESRTDQKTTVAVTMGVLATGEYNDKLITSDTDLLKANRDYAVVGMGSNVASHALTIKAPDFGNIRVGCPGALDSKVESQFFMIMSRMTGKTLVPVFNTGNKSTIYLGQVANENAVASIITAHLVLLK